MSVVGRSQDRNHVTMLARRFRDQRSSFARAQKKDFHLIDWPES
jgi:hypothetical protein